MEASGGTRGTAKDGEGESAKSRQSCGEAIGVARLADADAAEGGLLPLQAADAVKEAEQLEPRDRAQHR